MKAMEKNWGNQKARRRKCAERRDASKEIKVREQRLYRDSSREIRARLCIKGERIGAKKDGTGAEFAENQPISAAAKSGDGDYATANETTIGHDDGFHEKVSVINAEEHNWNEFLFLLFSDEGRL